MDEDLREFIRQGFEDLKAFIHQNVREAIADTRPSAPFVAGRAGRWEPGDAGAQFDRIEARLDAMMMRLESWSAKSCSYDKPVVDDISSRVRGIDSRV